MSPIHSFDHEDENDDDEDGDVEDECRTAIYHKALQDSIDAQSFVSERSSLLRQGGDPHSRLHPLWDPPPGDQETQSIKGNWSPWGKNWGTGICILSGVYLAVMGILDAYHYIFLLQESKQEDSETSLESSRIAILPWLAPSPRTLLLCGALQSTDVFTAYGFWRLATSAVIPCSLVEWLVVVASWRMILLASPPTPWYRWSGVFLASTVTGQLFLIAFDTNALAGCVSWGTCAVLTSLGVICPPRRLVLHLTAIIILMLAMLQRPYGSVTGAAGSMFFAWTCTGAGLIKLPSRHKPEYEETFAQQFQRWLCIVGAISVLTLPVLWMLI